MCIKCVVMYRMCNNLRVWAEHYLVTLNEEWAYKYTTCVFWRSHNCDREVSIKGGGPDRNTLANDSYIQTFKTPCCSTHTHSEHSIHMADSLLNTKKPIFVSFQYQPTMASGRSVIDDQAEITCTVNFSCV